GKKLPANISEDAEEGEVSDEDSADEMDDDCKLMNGDASSNRKRVENLAKKKLDSLIKESKIRDCEDQNNFAVTTLSSSGKLGNKPDLKKKKSSKLKRTPSLEDREDDFECQGNLSRTSVPYSKSGEIHKIRRNPRRGIGNWQVSSFSETKAHQILQQKPAQYLRFNQHQLSRIYPSSYRVDSSNYNPQPFWNAGCQLGIFNPTSEDPLAGQMKKQLIIDPFVEVEVIGLPMDCCKEQTRVVDDNEIALVRFLVWDHDPIGRDFIGQRTIAFTSMMPGYRHVYLEGMEEASVFVHVAVNDVCGKVSSPGA
ncbi:hypothetical protein E2320_006202, partial [Naja naja]